jgi:hypothetical protein
MGGECNYLLRVNPETKHLEFVPDDEWMTPEMLAWDEEGIMVRAALQQLHDHAICCQVLHNLQLHCNLTSGICCCAILQAVHACAVCSYLTCGTCVQLLRGRGLGSGGAICNEKGAGRAADKPMLQLGPLCLRAAAMKDCCRLLFPSAAAGPAERGPDAAGGRSSQAAHASAADTQDSLRGGGPNSAHHL